MMTSYPKIKSGEEGLHVGGVGEVFWALGSFSWGGPGTKKQKSTNCLAQVPPFPRGGVGILWRGLGESKVGRDQKSCFFGLFSAMPTPGNWSQWAVTVGPCPIHWGEYEPERNGRTWDGVWYSYTAKSGGDRRVQNLEGGDVWSQGSYSSVLIRHRPSPGFAPWWELLVSMTVHGYTQRWK